MFALCFSIIGILLTLAGFVLGLTDKHASSDKADEKHTPRSQAAMVMIILGGTISIVGIIMGIITIAKMVHP